jgi:hypothetical protein
MGSIDEKRFNYHLAVLRITVAGDGEGQLQICDISISETDQEKPCFRVVALSLEGIDSPVFSREHNKVLDRLRVDGGAVVGNTEDLRSSSPLLDRNTSEDSC